MNTPGGSGFAYLHNFALGLGDVLHGGISERTQSQPRCKCVVQSGIYERMKSKEIGAIGKDNIANSIVVLRQQRVLLDSDLARLYGVTTKRLNEQVRRNRNRFPADFLFRVRSSELEALNRSQTATGSQRHRDPRFPPYAFTEHGAIMAATVLNSSRAVEMSVFVVRAFIQLRDILATNKELAYQFAVFFRGHPSIFSNANCFGSDPQVES